MFGTMELILEGDDKECLCCATTQCGACSVFLLNASICIPAETMLYMLPMVDPTNEPS